MSAHKPIINPKAVIILTITHLHNHILKASELFIPKNSYKVKLNLLGIHYLDKYIFLVYTNIVSFGGIMDTLVFNSGNSQAVRIPKEFRFKTKVVTILKQGKDLILKEKQPLSWNEIYKMPCDCDFQLQREDNCIPQNRELF